MEPDFLGLNLSSATYWGFPGGTGVKNLPANTGNTGDAGLILGMGRFPRVGNGNPCQYSCLENSMDRGAWHAYSPWGCKESDRTEVTKQKDVVEWGRVSR